MNQHTVRFCGTFLFLMACFLLSGDTNIFHMLHLPEHIALPIVTALTVAALVYRVNLWTISTVCFFLYLANSGLPTSGIVPTAEISLAIAIALAFLPTLNDWVSG